MHLYIGKFDLTFTALQIPFLGICAPFFATGAWRDAPWTENTTIIALCVVPLALSFVFACRANRNVSIALFVFLMKYIYAAVMLGLGFIALFIGLVTLPYAGKSEYLSDEARDFLWHFTKSPGIGATLLRCVGRWNRKLIRPVNILKESEPASNINSDGNEGADVLRNRE